MRREPGELDSEEVAQTHAEDSFTTKSGVHLHFDVLDARKPATEKAHFKLRTQPSGDPSHPFIDQLIGFLDRLFSRLRLVPVSKERPPEQKR